MKNVIVFGSIPLTTKVIKLFANNNKINIIGVCCTKLENNWRDFQGELNVYDYCKKNNINILTHDDILNLSPDLGFSIRYNKILSEEVINKFKNGIVNTHGGILPEYRGTYAEMHALINGEEYFGATLHYIDKGIDTGDIIDIKKEKISKSDTGIELYLKGEILCYELIENNLNNLINDRISAVPQNKIIKNNNINPRTFKSDDLYSKKEIYIKDLDTSKTLNIIKAFDSPFHKPAYYINNGERVYLRYKNDIKEYQINYI